MIQEVDDLGGMTKAIESGMAKRRIEESATRKQARIDSGEEVVVGINKYRVETDTAVPVHEVDNAKSRAKQMERLAQVRAARNEEEVAAVLAELRESAALPLDSPVGASSNLLGLAIKAARARATVGEISDALRTVWGEHSPSTEVVQGAYTSAYTASPQEDAASDYAQVLAIIDDFATKEGRRPRILVAKMGQDGHDRGAKVIASGFADLGYDVDVGPLFQTPSEVAQQAIDADVHVVGISSQAAGHKALVPALIEELKAKGAGNMVIICGGVIPPQDHAFLHDCGVTAIFGPGTRIMDAASEVLDAVISKQVK